MVNDSDVTALIHKYLKAGVLINGKLEETTIGTPQGGNLSPLLSNIYLNELDKELERIGFSFWKDKGEWKSKPHKESFKKLFLKLKKLVKRSWSVDLTYRIKKINEVLRGRINYYLQASMKKALESRIGP